MYTFISKNHPDLECVLVAQPYLVMKSTVFTVCQVKKQIMQEVQIEVIHFKIAGIFYVESFTIRLMAFNQFDKLWMKVQCYMDIIITP